MGVSRVDFGEDTLIDLTQDTVTPHSLLNGYSAHNRAGEQINGEVTVPTKLSELENDEGYGKTIELTQDEYDALGEGKNSDNTLYMIKDGIPSVLDNCVLLWENPNPSVEFPRQNITLASDDYDILEVYYFFANNNHRQKMEKVTQNITGVRGIMLTHRNDLYIVKLFDVLDKKTVSFTNTEYYQYSGGAGSTDNALIIPYRIYGYKISGKYPSASDRTPAQNNIFSYDEVRIGTWVDGKPLYRKMVYYGALPNTPNVVKTVPHGILNVDHIHVDAGNCYFTNPNNTITYSFIQKGIFQLVIDKTDIRISVPSGDQSSNTATVCINYTKTTDTAG